MTATFDENITGFAAGDITVVNGSAGNLSGADDVYTFEVIPSGEGVVRVSMNENVVFDFAGNGNTASAELSRTYDSTFPTVSSIVRAETSPTNAASIDFSVTFSKVVTGVDSNDFTIDASGLTGASISNVSGSGDSYTVTVLTGTGDGTLSIDVIDDDSIIDVASNLLGGTGGGNGDYSGGEAYIIDKTAPTIVLSSTASDPTNTSPIPVTATFDENVTGFTAGDVTVVNGSVGNLSGTGAVFTFEVTPSGEGAVRVSIVENVAFDAAGNGNSASAELSRTYDSTVPTLTSITRMDASPTNAASVDFAVIFSKGVTGVDLSDFTVDASGLTGASISNVAGSGSTWTVTVSTGTGDGTLSIDVTDDDSITDMVANPLGGSGAGNGDYSGGEAYTIDRTSPTVVLSSSASDPTNTSPIPVTATFDENVTGFTANDITVVNGSAGNLSGADDVYTFEVTPSGEGIVRVSIGENVVFDASGNGNVASAELSRTYDSTVPTVSSVTRADTNPTNETSVDFTVVFSKDVTGVDQADFTVDVSGVTGASISNVAGSGNTWTVTVSTGTGDGSLSIDVADDDSIKDAAANPLGGAGADNGDYSGGEAYSVDKTAPTVELSSAVSDPTNTSPIPVTATFDENVTGFTAGDITVVNGSVGNLSGVDAVYTFDVTPSGNGIVRVNINQNAAIDSAGNGNLASAEISRTYDSTFPTVSSVTRADTNPTNETSIDFTVLFSKVVTGVDQADFTVDASVVTGAVITNVAGSGNTWTVTVSTGTGDGSLSIDVTDNDSIKDAAGNFLGGSGAGNGDYSGGEVYTIDKTAPTVSLSSTASDPTNTSPIPVTVIFNESVIGFTVDDVTVVNGIAENFGGSGAMYSFDVNPGGQGVVRININADAATDFAGNGNFSSTEFSRTYDTTAPEVVSVARVGSAQASAFLVDFTVTFSKAVTGVNNVDFTIDSIGLIGPVITGVTGDGDTYIVTVFTGTGEGVIRIDVTDDDSIKDVASNPLGGVGAGNGAYTTGETYAIDRTSPTLVISSTVSEPTNTSPIPVSVTFDESVTGFTEDDVTIVNGSISNFNGSLAAFAFTVIPSEEGVVRVSVAENVALDLAGNPNTASAELTRTYDSTVPTVTSVTRTGVSPTNAASVDFTVTFSKPVTGVDDSDFTVDEIGVTGGNIISVNGNGDTYTVTVSTGTGDGSLSVDVTDDDTIRDAAGNYLGGPGPETGTYTGGEAYAIDKTAPTVVISSTSSDPTNAASIPVTAMFNEIVTGFTAGDVVVVNGTVDNFSGTGSVYVFTVNPSGEGLIRVSINGNTAFDDSGNGNTASDEFLRTYDNTNPTVVSVMRVGASPANAATVDFTVTFSKSVTGVDQTDFTVDVDGITGASVSSADGNGEVWTVTVSTGTGDGTLGIDVRDDDTIADAAGNSLGGTGAGNGDYSGGEVYSIDKTVPTVALSSTASDPTNTSPIPVTATFDENVTGFEAGDVTVVNGTVGNFSGAEDVYTFDVTPSGDGVIRVNINQNAAIDSAGNGNAASAELTRSYDTTFPTVTSIMREGTGPTNATSINFTVTFSSPVMGVDPSDFTVDENDVTGSAVTSVTGGANNWTVTVSTGAGDGTLSIDVADDDSIKDAAGNSLGGSGLGNGAYTDGEVYTIDKTAPTIVISSISSDPTNTSPIPVKVTFNESVTGFTADGVTVVNGAVANFSGAGTVYTFEVIPSEEGLVRVSINGTIAFDNAGNGNAASDEFLRAYDSTAPTVVSVLRVGASPANGASVDFTVTFSKSVTGVDSTDFRIDADGVTGASVSGVSGNGEIWTVTVSTGTGDGTLGVDVTDDDTIKDSAGNLLGGTGAGNGAFASGEDYTIDKTVPTVVIASISDDPTNVSPIPVTIQFSEPVISFTQSGIMVTNGSVTNFMGSGADYSFELLPAGKGEVTAKINEDAVIDSAGNGNAVSNALSRYYDSEVPMVQSIMLGEASPSNAESVDFVVKFSKDVNGVDASDFIIDAIGISGAAVTGVAGDGDSRTVTVSTGTGDGSMSVDVVDNDSITDAASNPLGGEGAGNGTYTSGAAYTIDKTAPTLVLASSVSDPTNVSPIPVTVTFDENVTGFTAEDVNIENGSMGNFNGTGAVYTFDVTPLGEGLVRVSINETIAFDNAGNGNAAPDELSRTYDNTVPSVASVTRTVSGPTNASSVDFTVTFSSPVMGVDPSDFIVDENGVTGAVVTGVTGGATIWTVSVSTGTGDGTLGIDVTDDDSITDTAGNALGGIGVGNGSYAAGELYAVDKTVPTLMISSTLPNPTNVSPIPFTVMFDESVTGFTAGDITVINGEIKNFNGTGAVYTFEVTPSEEGFVHVIIGENIALDASGNGNAASTGLSRIYDDTAPSVASVTRAASNPTNAAFLDFTVTFSSPVVGVDLSDFTVDESGITGGALAGVSGGGDTWTVSVSTGTGDGTLSIDLVDDDSITDAAGNPLGGMDTGNGDYSGGEVYNIDKTAPTVTLSTTASDPTNRSPIPVTATFDENVTGFELDDVTVINGSVSNLSVTGSTYTFEVTPAGNGIVRVNINQNLTSDPAGNGNVASAELSRTYDSAFPTVTSITRSGASPVNAGSVDFTVTFSKAVTGVDSTDFTIDASGVTGVLISNVSGNGGSYTVTVLCGTGDGTLSMDVTDDDSITDAAGNPLGGTGVDNGIYSTGEVYTIDRTAPTVTITSISADPTNVSPIPLTIQFSEPVNGFAKSGIVVTNGSVTNFTGSGSDYSFELLPADKGEVTARVNEDAAMDNAGNGNAGSNILSRHYDSEVPMVESIVISGLSPSNAAFVDFIVKFSKAVIGVDASDFTVDATGISDAAVTGVVGNDDTYTVTVSTGTGDGALSVDVMDNDSIMDAASNPLGGEGPGNGTYTSGGAFTIDKTPPTFVLSSTVSDPTNVSPIPVMVTFNENVTGFTAADVTVLNGSIGNFSGTGAFYTFEVTPSEEGPVHVSIDENVVLDSSGNGNAASASLSRTYDNTAPSVATITRTTSTSTNATSVDFKVTFSKPVMGVDASDFTVTESGTAGSVIISVTGSATIWTVTVSIGTGDGTLSIEVADDDSIQDAAGNPLGGIGAGNGAYATGESYTIDKTAPTIAISSTSTDPTNISPIPVTVLFDENVTGFVAGDVTLSNGVIGNFSGTGALYTFEVTPTEEGLVYVTIDENVALDASGNGNAASTGLARTYDHTAPTVVSVMRTASNPTNAVSVDFMVTFSSPVEGLDLSDFTVDESGTTGAAVGGITGSGDTWTISVLTGSGDGTLGIDVADDDSITDAAGNPLGGTGAGNGIYTIGEVYTIDKTAPTVVSVVRVGDTPTNEASVDFMVTFSKSVSGVDKIDFTLDATGVSDAAIDRVTGGDDTYTVTVATGTGDGTLSIDVADDDSIRDAAENTLSGVYADGEVYAVDKTAPIPLLASIAPDPTHVSPIPVTVTFDENVTGFTAEDVTVANGTVDNFDGSGSIYTFEVIPSAQDAVTIQVGALITTDLAGNGNEASGVLTRIYDNQAPVVVSVLRMAGNPTNAADVDFKVNFSKSVTGVDKADFTLDTTGVSNAAIDNVTGAGDSWTVTVSTGTGDGTLGIDVADDDSIVDAAGNPLGGAGSGNGAYTAGEVYAIDKTSPTVVLSSTAPNPTNISPIPVTATFNENVTGFALGDVTVVNGSAGNFSGADAVYTFDVTPSGEGVVRVSVNENVAFDASGNGNVTSAEFSRTYDNTAPSVISVTRAGASPTNAVSVDFTVTFSKNVTGVDKSDFTPDTAGISNAAIQSVTGSGSIYTVSVLTGEGDGSLSIDVSDDGSIRDAAGNNLGGAYSDGGIYDVDKTAPAPVLVSIVSDPTHISPIPVTVTFDENVTGFTVDDLTVENGSVDNFDGSGAAYAFDVTPSGQVAVTVHIAAMAVTDSAGNGNASETSISRTYDSIAPVVSSVVRSNDTPTNAGFVGYIVTFSEPVSGVDQSGFTVYADGITGAAVTGVSGGGAVYTVSISTGTGDGTLRLDVSDDDSIKDVALNLLGGSGSGNGTYSDGETYTIDKTSPVATLTNLPQDLTKEISASILVSGEGVTVYKWRLDGVAWSESTPVAEPIDLAGLLEGTHHLDVIGGDDAGNWQSDADPATCEWTVDVTAPNITGLADNFIPARSVTWIWSANESAMYRFTVDQSETWLPSGPFGTETTTTLSGINGTRYLHIQAKDQVGNISGVITVSAVFDNVAPVAGLSGCPFKPIKETSITLSVTGSEIASYKWRLDGAQWSEVFPVAQAIQVTGLGEGNHTVDVVGSDIAGNWQSDDDATACNWLVDITPPEITGLTNDLTPAKTKTWEWSANENAIYRFKIDESTGWIPSGAYGETTTASIEGVEGIRYLHVQAKDVAGNASAVKTVLALLDNSTVVTIDGGDRCSLLADISLSGTREPGDIITISCANVTARDVTYPKSTTWRATLSGILPGENTVTAHAIDAAANQNEDSVIISYFVPLHAEVQTGSGELLANGVSTLAMSAIILDGLGNRVCEGAPVTVNTDLGQIDPGGEYFTDANGQIDFTLRASSALGTATITVTYNGDAIGTGSVEMNPGAIDRLVITTPPQTVYVGYPSSRIFVEAEDAFGHAVNVGNDILIYLSSNSENSSEFATIENAFQWQRGGSIMKIYAKTSSSFFKFRDSQAGPWTLKAEELTGRGWNDAGQQIDVIYIPDVFAQLQGVPDQYEGFSNQANAEIIVSGSDLSAYKYRLDGGTWSDERNLNMHIILTDLEEGRHTIDVCGKSQVKWQPDENATSASWTLDTSGPGIVTNPADGAYSTQQLVSLECLDGDGCGCEKIYYTTDGSVPTTVSNDYHSPIAIGADTRLSFYGVDYLGNAGQIKTVDYVIDDVSPSDIAINYPQDGAWVKPMYSIEGTAIDNESGIQKVEVQLKEGSYYLTAEGKLTTIPTWIEALLLGGGDWKYDLSFSLVDGKEYSLTARATDRAGNTSIRMISFSYGVEKLSSVISCIVSQTDAIIGDEIIISGKIEPAPDINTPISVVLVSPGMGQEFYFNAYTNFAGEFSFDLPCTALTQEGKWSVYTRWEGNDTYLNAKSETTSFSVVKAYTHIEISLSSQSIKLGDTIKIFGKISSSPDCGTGRSGLSVKINFMGPPEVEGGDPVSKSADVVTSDKFGRFVLEDYTGFDQLGVWSVQAEFTGNSAYMSGQSDISQVGVLETAGYAIIIEGKISNSEGIKSHNKTTNLTHDVFMDRGLIDDDMMYFNYDLSEPGADAKPTQAGIQDAVTTWAKDKMNTKPANLYIVMVDHGMKDRFYIDQGKDVNNEDLETITPGEMDQWLDDLQAGLNDQAKNQQLTVILGFCHSGSFIDELQGENRIILSSSNVEEVSYKGPEKSDGVRGGDYFVDQFFENVRSGLAIQGCFAAAATNTEEYTKPNKNILNSNYYTPTEQHPQLFNHELASTTYIGVSTYSGNAPGDVFITGQSDAVFLNSGEVSTDLWAKVDDSERLMYIWIEVKRPEFEPDIGTGQEQLEMDLYKQVGQYNADTDRYEWNNLAIFDEPGAYQVMYFAEDAITHNLSHIRETMVYKSKADNQPPLDFNLVEPVDGQVALTLLAFYWQDSRDPDGDDLSYTLMVSDNATDFSSAIVVSNIEPNFYLFDGGLADLHTYYWKVRAIDGYGAVTESPVGYFFTDNSNAVQGWFTGRIYNYITGAMIDGATIRIQADDFDQVFRSGAKGYFLGTSDSGTYTIHVGAPGFSEQVLEGFVIPDGDRVVQDVGLQPAQTGDLDGDGNVSLSDAVIVWQALAGIDVSGVLRSDYVSSDADVNGDGKVGIEEGVYILRMISGN